MLRLYRHFLFGLLLGALLMLLFQILADAATVQLTWDAPVWPSGETPIPLATYIVERDGAEIARTAATLFSDNVPPGTYLYTVRALYSDNQRSAPSNAASATVGQLPALPVPLALRCVFTQPPDPTFTCTVVSGPPPGPYPLRPLGSVTVQAVDSQEVGNEGTLAVDGQMATFWHTQYRPSSAPLPHTLTLDLGTLLWIDGLSYAPRTDGETNGTIVGYKLESSGDGQQWQGIIPQGVWAPDTTVKSVRFAATQARYLRLVATAEIHNQPWTSAAEVSVYGALP